jgi:CDP-paratose 2-epimerase
VIIRPPRAAARSTVPSPSLPDRILVTGGAGFVGASVCLALAERHPGAEVVALDSLKRRGSELNLPRLREAGVRFVHGDVRSREDLLALEPVEAIVECSAEPSVLAGMGSGADFVVQTNLVGAHHCLELARRDDAQLLFVSTSRVYPVKPLEQLHLETRDDRFVLTDDQPVPGASAAGISEVFPLEGARTLYGATKLAAELLVAEYADAFGVRTVVDRCGVIAGPWQMGKVDQGVFTHWLLSHHAGRPLTYLGYGGSGRQVRDLLHVDDFCELVLEQLADPDGWHGATVNVGGGLSGSLSLRETTALCREITGREVPVEPVLEHRPGDVPLYVSDCTRLFARTDWRPRRTPRAVLEDTYEWILAHERDLLPTLVGAA